MKNRNQGFTLIEMLVVIAMIGLLSAVVLVALGPSRNKAKDTRIISDVNQARSIGETLYDSVSGGYTFCPAAVASTTPFTQLSTDITNQGGSFSLTCSSTSLTYSPEAAYGASLNSGKYCVDTTGLTSASTTGSSGSCQ